ncbi:unnamed protein product [Fusarium fujikuroi]|nr:unnamed protein product [Fusarium fujikuroi]
MAGDNLPHARRSHNVQEPQRKCRQRAWPKPSDLHDNTATNTYTRRIVVFASWWLMLNTSRPSTRGSKGTAREAASSCEATDEAESKPGEIRGN